MHNLRAFICALVTAAAAGCGPAFAAGQEGNLTVAVDAAVTRGTLPKLLRPGIDLSGRGVNKDKAWPQSMAGKDAVDAWQKAQGLKNLYRVQFNLWELQEAAKDPKAYEQLKANYLRILSAINDDGGTAIVSFFGMPSSMGKVKDKMSPPANLRAYKALVKATIKELSCEKKFRVWYEVWNAPDLDDFFIGTKQEYLAMYRAAAEAVKELKKETGAPILIGGPGTSWWFQSIDGNTISTPERSLIYEFIRYCDHYRIPLDFISWHAYSSDPRAEEAMTIYRKSEVPLIRDWLRYFHFNPATPLVIDEWNYDCGDNVTPARGKESYRAASYIPARLMHMQEAGIDHAVYYSLEDFQGNADNVVRNVGVFTFAGDSPRNKGGPAPKASFGAFRMMEMLGGERLAVSPKVDDEFVSLLASRSQDTVTILISNYIDPDIVNNYLTRVIGMLGEGEKRQVLSALKNKKLGKFLNGEIPLRLLAGTARVKGIFTSAAQLYARAEAAKAGPRQVQVSLKGLPWAYALERYVIDEKTVPSSDLAPVSAAAPSEGAQWQDTLSLSPYSVTLLVFRKAALPPPPAPAQETPAETNATGEKPAAVNASAANVAGAAASAAAANVTAANITAVNVTVEKPAAQGNATKE